MSFFYPQFSPLSPDWLPTLRLSPPPLSLVLVKTEGPPIKVTDVVSGVGGGVNEGISRDSSQLKEAFCGEVNGNSVTPSWFPLLQWFLLFHGLLLGPVIHGVGVGHRQRGHSTDCLCLLRVATFGFQQRQAKSW